MTSCCAFKRISETTILLCMSRYLRLQEIRTMQNQTTITRKLNTIMATNDVLLKKIIAKIINEKFFILKIMQQGFSNARI